MIISNAALNALLIYAAKHGPLVIPQAEIISFNDKFVGLKLEQDGANFLVSANILAPDAVEGDEEHEAIMALGDAAVGKFVPDAVRSEIEQVKKSLPNNDMFGPSTLFGGPLQMRGHTTARQEDGKVVSVQMVMLNGGPSDGQSIALKLPLKRIVFLADKPSRTNEINDFVPAHAYMREDTPAGDDSLLKGRVGCRYVYVGFKSREEIKEQFQDKFMDAPDAADWWKGGDDAQLD